MSDNDLRQRIKVLKAFYDIPYKDIANYFNMKYNSFHSWLKGYYNFKAYRLINYYHIIDNIESLVH